MSRAHGNIPDELLQEHALSKDEWKERVENHGIGRMKTYAHSEVANSGYWPAYEAKIAVDQSRFMGSVENIGELPNAVEEAFPEAVETSLSFGYKGAMDPGLLLRVRLITEEMVEEYESEHGDTEPANGSISFGDGS